MLISWLTEAGSIREHNQDAVYFDSKRHLALLADGKGPDGSIAARYMLQHWSAGLLENAFFFSDEEGQRRLAEFAIEALAQTETEYPSSIDGFAAIWIHRGKVNLLWHGNCLIAGNRKFTGIPHLTMPAIKSVSLDFCQNNHFFMFSEGIKVALQNNYLKNLFEDLKHRFSFDKLQFFWNEAALSYDGDDRTIVAIQLEKSDQSVGEAKEMVLFTDFDRQFSIPLWLPLAISMFFSMLGLFAATKIYKLLNSDFPQLKNVLKLHAALRPLRRKMRQKNKKHTKRAQSIL